MWILAFIISFFNSKYVRYISFFVFLLIIYFVWMVYLFCKCIEVLLTLYFCTIMHFRYINIKIYIPLFFCYLCWTEMKKSSVCFVNSICSYLSTLGCFAAVFVLIFVLFFFFFVMFVTFILHCLCFFQKTLRFSMPKSLFVHKPNTCCCFWHLHWDKQSVLNRLNIWQKPLPPLCLYSPSQILETTVTTSFICLELDSWFTLDSGVPQGALLGPVKVKNNVLQLLSNWQNCQHPEVLTNVKRYNNYNF